MMMIWNLIFVIAGNGKLISLLNRLSWCIE